LRRELAKATVVKQRLGNELKSDKTLPVVLKRDQWARGAPQPLPDEEDDDDDDDDAFILSLMKKMRKRKSMRKSSACLRHLRRGRGMWRQHQRARG